MPPFILDCSFLSKMQIKLFTSLWIAGRAHKMVPSDIWRSPLFAWRSIADIYRNSSFSISSGFCHSQQVELVHRCRMDRRINETHSCDHCRVAERHYQDKIICGANPPGIRKGSSSSCCLRVMHDPDEAASATSIFRPWDVYICRQCPFEDLIPRF